MGSLYPKDITETKGKTVSIRMVQKTVPYPLCLQHHNQQGPGSDPQISGGVVATVSLRPWTVVCRSLKSWSSRQDLLHYQTRGSQASKLHKEHSVQRGVASPNGARSG